MKIDVYSKKGVKKSTKITLPKIFTEADNERLLAQAIRVYKDLKYFSSGKTKTRSEISKTKAKMWKQKGTGRARHGAASAPIFVGGSKAHGPKGVKRSLKLPSKMKKRALSLALSKKVKDGRIFIIEDLSTLNKTKEVHALITKLAKGFGRKSPRFTFVLPGADKKEKLGFRNLQKSNAIFFKDLNAYDVFYGGVLFFDKNTLSAEKTNTKKK